MAESIDIENIVRRCYKCGETKSLKEFRKKTKSPLGYGYICKICHNKQKAKWRKDNRESYYERNKDKIKEYNKKYYEKNKEKIKEYGKKYNKKQSEIYRELKETLIEKNGGRCFICGFKGDSIAFDIHHVNEDGYKSDWSKSYNLNFKIRILSDWVENELPDDIQLLCANCHRTIHNTPRE